MYDVAIHYLENYSSYLKNQYISQIQNYNEETGSDKESDPSVKDVVIQLAYQKMLADPSLNDAQQLLVRLCMAELEGRDGLAGVTLTTAEMDILTGLLANTIVAQEKKEEVL